MNLSRERAEAVERLARAGCVAAEEEADELVDAAPSRTVLEAWLRRREQGEPLAWITGATTFCGRRVGVDPGVFPPRLQTEELARRAAALVPGTGRALDLCTGCGAVAVVVAAARPGAAVVGVDVDRRAARCARGNGVHVVIGDLGTGIRPRCWDVVTAVPPYVPTDALRFLPADTVRYEPRAALDGGADGLSLVRRVVADAARLLRPAGWLLLEIGGDQDGPVEALLGARRFDEVDYWSDDDGDLRGVAARLARQA